MHFIFKMDAARSRIKTHLVRHGTPALIIFQDFNPDIFSARRIVVAPAVTVIGFVLMIVGILKNSKNKEVAE